MFYFTSSWLFRAVARRRRVTTVESRTNKHKYKILYYEKQNNDDIVFENWVRRREQGTIDRGETIIYVLFFYFVESRGLSFSIDMKVS